MPASLLINCGASGLRDLLRKEGFEVPDRYSEQLCAALGGRFTPQQHQAETDALVEEALADPQLGTDPRRSPIEHAFRTLPERRDDETPDPMLEATRAQKRREANHIDLSLTGLINDKAGVKAYGKAAAKARGFGTARSVGRSGPGLWKVGPGGVAAQVEFDTGGRSGPWWSVNGLRVRLLRPDGTLATYLKPWDIVRGMSWYASAHPGMAALERLARENPLDPNNFSVAQFWAAQNQHPDPPEQVSDEMKVCIAATLAFYDLLIQHLVMGDPPAA